MKAVVYAALLALCFTTGFTCSKNQPAAEQAQTQEQVAPATEATAAQPATEQAAPAAEQPAGH